MISTSPIRTLDYLASLKVATICQRNLRYIIHTLLYCIKWLTYTPYAGAAEIFVCMMENYNSILWIYI